MTAKVILNPYAGRWLAQKRQAEAEAALQAGGIDYELSITNEPGHGLLLAEQAAREGFSPIISAGGDGSISEVANGVAKAAETNGELAEGAHLTPIGVLPLGTANDLVDNLGLPKDLQAAVAVIAAGKTRLMDLCIVNGRYFDNNSAIGLEPFITLIQQDMKRLKGTLRYLVATLRGVFAKPEWSMQLEWDNGEYRGPITLVTVGNSPRTGGLFYVTPHANPFDGKLTFVYGYMPTRMQILKLLPRTMKPGEGNYVEHPDIHEVHTTWLRVHSDQPTPAHADGEIISPAIHDLEYRVYPARLPILIP
ncbi:MAG TPA: YegS/Rv2252/BmrU family lipid kinase [Anaerolineales bacterium]|nr:YegS/Rv2252/BmrU family lipid kinase [Anaerolineales bacterium]